MHSADSSARRLPRRNANDHVRTISPGPIVKDRINPRTHQLGPVAVGAGVAVVVFLLFLAASPWLPDLTTRERKDLPGTPTATSAATTPSPLEQPDNGGRLASNPLIPIVIRRSTPPDTQVSDLPPEPKISPPLVTVPEPVDSASTRPQPDLRDIEDAKRVQQRLIDLGFLFGGADGIWGSRSRRALQDFKAANGIGDNDTWDEATRERLLTTADANAASSDITFVGGWAVDAAACRQSAITITAQRAADGFGAACEFHSTQRESLSVWRLRALCANNSERWNANIRFTLSGTKLTWSSERGTTAYVRCPN
jgi:peptidoglycan hydrolase-like protein with peptidoglycan-binding domain